MGTISKTTLIGKAIDLKELEDSYRSNRFKLLDEAQVLFETYLQDVVGEYTINKLVTDENIWDEFKELWSIFQEMGYTNYIRIEYSDNGYTESFTVNKFTITRKKDKDK